MSTVAVFSKYGFKINLGDDSTVNMQNKSKYSDA